MKASGKDQLADSGEDYDLYETFVDAPGWRPSKGKATPKAMKAKAMKASRKALKAKAMKASGKATKAKGKAMASRKAMKAKAMKASGKATKAREWWRWYRVFLKQVLSECSYLDRCEAEVEAIARVDDHLIAAGRCEGEFL
jgi:hypothetical protein